MDLSLLVKASQIAIALVVFNVWILRATTPSPYRGGEARTLREEFDAYGLPTWAFATVRVVKLGFAALLIVGLWEPSLTRLGAAGIAVLMLGAVAMHVKIKDEWQKSMPAAALLLLSLLVLLAS